MIKKREKSRYVLLVLKSFFNIWKLKCEEMKQNEKGENLLNNKDKKTVLVESKAVAETEFLMKGRLAIATIHHDDYKKLDGRGELVLRSLGQIHGVEYIVLLKEQKEKQIGISFRSRSKPVNQIDESFGGGGHLFAAGAVVPDSLENVHDKVVNAFKGI